MRSRRGQRIRAGRGSRARIAAAVGLSAACAALTLSVAFAASSKTVEITDPKGDVTGALDLQRASLSLASDGRLRAVITLVGKAEPQAMLSKVGPPGSACVKVWTAQDADPTSSRADRLVCVTARSKDELRAIVFSQAKLGPPTLLGPAEVSVNESGRSLVLRFSQSSLGRPELIRFAIESTRAGCERVSCVDQLPDKGGVRRFRVR